MAVSVLDRISTQYRWLQTQLVDKPVTVHDEGDSLKRVYKVGKRIDGDGKRSLYGQVRLCRHRQMGFSRAIKSYSLSSPIFDPATQTITFRDQNGLSFDEVLNEVIIMGDLKHPNLVSLHDVFYEQDFIHLVMDLCKGGELYDMILTQRHLTELKALQLFGQLLLGIKYMHSVGVAHRALCIENVMLYDREQTRVKIISFSNAGRITPTPFSNRHGSPMYMSPEAFSGSYTHKCDIWAAGVILFTMFCGYQPYAGNTIEELEKLVSVFSIPRTAEWNSLAPSLKELIEQMLTREATRLPASELLRHNTLAKVMDQSQDFGDDAEEQAENEDYYEKVLLGNKLKFAADSFICCKRAISEGALDEARNKLGLEDKEHTGYLPEQTVVSTVRATKMSKDQALEGKLQQAILQTPRENGQLHYATFLLALEQEGMSKATLEKWFLSFDKENTGGLLVSDISNYFAGSTEGGEIWEEICRDCGRRGITCVSFPEFCELLLKHSA